MKILWFEKTACCPREMKQFESNTWKKKQIFKTKTITIQREPFGFYEVPTIRL